MNTQTIQEQVFNDKFYLSGIENFIKQKGFPTNGWFYTCENQEVYLRKSRRMINGKHVQFIDIANIKTHEAHQGKGRLTNFLSFLKDLGLNIYFENVLNEILIPFLLKNGYAEDVNNEKCFYKISSYKTILQHLHEIEDKELRERCLANIDERYQDNLVYTKGMAVMLGVNGQHQYEKDYWNEAYRLLLKQDTY